LKRLAISTLLTLIFLTSCALAQQAVHVYFEPSSLEVKPEEAFTVEVRIDPGDAGVSAAELHVSYPSNALSLLNVSLGEFFGSEPLTALSEYDGGVVKYAIARVGSTPKPTPPGTVLTLNFQVKQQAPPGNYVIEFTKVDLVDESFNRITSFTVDNFTLTIAQVVVVAEVKIKVLDKQTNQPIAGALVTVNGVQGVTDEQGVYQTSLQPGQYSIQVSKSGYQAFSKTITVQEGVLNEVIINLEPVQKPPSQPPKKGCLIATAAFGSELAPQVQFLRSFRDNEVLSTTSGKTFLTVFNSWYYSWSPYVAELERQNAIFKQAVKYFLYPLIAELMICEKAYMTLASLNKELAIVAAGVIASFLIGLTYFTPLTLLTRMLFKKLYATRLLKLSAAFLASSLAFHYLMLTFMPELTLITSPAIVLSTIALASLTLLTIYEGVVGVNT